MRFWLYAIALLVLMSVSNVALAADSYKYEYVTINKPVYGPNETITLYLKLLNSTNSTVVNHLGNITVYNSSGNLSFNTTVNLTSQTVTTKEINTSLISLSAGTYMIVTNFSDPSNNTLQTIQNFTIISSAVDKAFINPTQSVYYTDENLSFTLRVMKQLSTGDFIGVANVSITGFVVNSSGSEASGLNFTGTTDNNGEITFNNLGAVPSALGTYKIVIKNFGGATAIFKVLEYESALSIKDSTGKTIKFILTPGESAKVDVKVSRKGSTASLGGNYTFAGNITNSTGSVIVTINSTVMGNTSSYSNSYPFTINGDFIAGDYAANVVVASPSGNKITRTEYFKVRPWDFLVLTLSGFESGVSAFVNKEIFFKVFVTNMTTGVSIENVTLNISVLDSSSNNVKNLTSSFNKTFGYHKTSVNLTATGEYTLLIIANLGSDRIQSTSFIRVVSDVAKATPADKTGNLKEVFDGKETIFFILKATNSTGQTRKPHQIELKEIKFEGSQLNYTLHSNFSNDNTTNKYKINLSYDIGSDNVSVVKLDNPRTGGSYVVSFYLDNKSVVASSRFEISPYQIEAFPYSCPKGQTDYERFEFSTKDCVVFTLEVERATRKSGSAKSKFSDHEKTKGGSGIGYSGGSGSSSRSSGNEVVNATVSVLSILNEFTGKKLPTGDVNISVASTTNNDGEADVTLTPNNKSWDAGEYIVKFQVNGTDGSSGVGFGRFSAQPFFISGRIIETGGMGGFYGFEKFMVKPSDNLTLRINMYDASSNQWWGYYYAGGSGSRGGLGGTAQVEKIRYFSQSGSSSEINHTIIGNSTTISDGIAELNITNPSGGWKSGFYELVVKGTKDDGTIAYGKIPFIVKNWDVYANPVDTTSFSWKESFSPSSNITFYMNINNAGAFFGGQKQALVGKNVSITVKEIIDLSSSPERVMDKSNYTASVVYANESSNMWSMGKNESYILHVKPNEPLASGFYNVIFDVNGSEEGFGFFSVEAFYASAELGNVTGSRLWNSRGAPFYFNVTTATDGSAKNLINTTITDITMRVFSSSNYNEVVYKLSEGSLNVSSTNITGSKIINVTGSFVSGWYTVEVELQNSAREKDVARSGFSTRSFMVNAYSNSYEIGKSQPVVANLDFRDPSDYRTLAGNYSVLSIISEQWGSSYTSSVLNSSRYNITYEQRNTSSPNITISQGSGWSSGYQSLRIVFNDTSGNTESAWVSFKTESFKVSISTNQYTVSANSNITINVTVNSGGTVNVSSVVEEYWNGFGYTQSTYNFTPTQITSSGTLIIPPPGGAWDEKWHSIKIYFVEPSDATQKVDKSASFEVKSYSYQFYPNDAFGGYKSQFGLTDTIRLFLGVGSSSDGWWASSKRNVTVLNISVGKQESCYGSSCNTINVSFRLAGNDTKYLIGNDTLILNQTFSANETGRYTVKVVFNGSAGLGQAIDYFYITEEINVTLTNPTSGQTINTTGIAINITTTKSLKCSYSLYCNMPCTRNNWTSLYERPKATTHNFFEEGLQVGNYTLSANCIDDNWKWATRTVNFTKINLTS